MELAISKADSRPSSAAAASCCDSCHLVLRDPHVECCDCPDAPSICLDCFAKGCCFGSHKATHRYRVVNDSFSVLEPEWTAEEESTLLSLLLERGQGSWEDISKGLQGSKSAEQCRDHFDAHYVDNQSGLLSDHWKDRSNYKRRDQPVAFAAPTEYPLPPRPQSGSAAHKDLAGYNPARGDFDHELFNTAELEIANVSAEAVEEGYRSRRKLGKDDSAMSDNDLDSLLQLSAMEVYNDRLRERQRIKKIVREYGLLNKSKELSASARQEQLAAMGGPGYGRLKRFAKLMCSYDFDFMLEGLKHELTLRQNILHLQEFRRNGLTRLDSTAFFAKLKRLRERNLREVPADGVSDWVRAGCFPRAVDPTSSALPAAMTSSRRAAPPLDLVGLPGVGRLNQEERELCSTARVQPEVFLELREAMVRECEENDGLRLADARPLAKMDVNKTRKVYDFLIARGDIRKPQ